MYSFFRPQLVFTIASLLTIHISSVQSYWDKKVDKPCSRWGLKENEHMCGGDKRTRLICLMDSASGIPKLRPFKDEKFPDKCPEDHLCWPLWRHDTLIKGAPKTQCLPGVPPQGFPDGQWACSADQYETKARVCDDSGIWYWTCSERIKEGQYEWDGNTAGSLQACPGCGSTPGRTCNATFQNSYDEQWFPLIDEARLKSPKLPLVNVGDTYDCHSPPPVVSDDNGDRSRLHLKFVCPDLVQ